MGERLTFELNHTKGTASHNRLAVPLFIQIFRSIS